MCWCKMSLSVQTLHSKFYDKNEYTSPQKISEIRVVKKYWLKQVGSRNKTDLMRNMFTTNPHWNQTVHYKNQIVSSDALKL